MLPKKPEKQGNFVIKPGNAVLVFFLQLLLIHEFACLVYSIYGQERLWDYLALLFLILPMLLLLFIRLKSKNFFIFILLHMIISGLFLQFSFQLFPQLWVSFGIGTGLLFILSIRKRLLAKYELEECPPMISPLLFLFSYFISWWQGVEILGKISLYELFLFLILFLSYHSLSNTSDFLKSNERMKNLPAGQIKGMNKMLLAGFLLLMIGMIFLLSLLPAGGFMPILKQGLRGFVRGIIQLFILLYRLFKRKEDPEEPLLDNTSGDYNIEWKEPSALLIFIEKVLSGLFTLLAILFLFYMVWKLLVWMYRSFYENQRLSTDETEFLQESKHHLVQTVTNRKKRRQQNNPKLKTTPALQIRQLYRHFVRKQTGKQVSVPDTLTPDELEAYLQEKEVLSEASYQAARNRVALYEQARYSKEPCRKEDVDKMKQFVKQKS